MNVWHVSGGPTDRSYADVLLKHGVALIGSGDTGPWRPDRLGMDDSVRRFATDIELNDVVLLRTGVASIRAVGRVAGDYLYLPQFDDVNGWDLQHARRVRWFQLPDEFDFSSRVFGASPGFFGRVQHPEVVDYATRFVNSPPTFWQTAALPPLPAEAPPLTDVPTALQPLVAQVLDLAESYWDRTVFGDHPTEDEMLAHYVVPLLRALGWPPERIALKWRRVDTCLFNRLPRMPENVHLIIEAKRLGAGVEGALAQAKGYLDDLGIRRDILVTDGIRYRLYSAEAEFTPVAYANLARLKQPAIELFAHLRQP